MSNALVKVSNGLLEIWATRDIPSVDIPYGNKIPPIAIGDIPSGDIPCGNKISPMATRDIHSEDIPTRITAALRNM